MDDTINGNAASPPQLSTSTHASSRRSRRSAARLIEFYGDVKEDIRRFKSLPWIDEGVMRVSLPRFRHSAVVARHAIRHQIAIERTLVIAGLVAGLAIILAIFAIKASLGAFVLSLTVFLLSLVVLILVIVPLGLRDYDIAAFFAAYCSIVSLLAGLGLLIYLLGSNIVAPFGWQVPSRRFDWVGLALIRASIAHVLLSLMAGYSVLLGRVAGERMSQRLYPDVAIAWSLYVILDELHDAGSRGLSLGSRKAAMRNLEIVAYSLERALPKSLRSSDPVTDSAIQAQFRNNAGAVRQLKHWIATPKADTLPEFANIVAGMLRSALAGEWDSFPRLEPERLSRRQRTSRILGVLKSLLIGAIPFLCLEAARRAGAQIASPLSDTLTLVTILWATLTYIGLVDPSYASKLGSIKELISIVAPSSKGRS